MGFLKCLFHNTQMCHMCLCIYQILHNKIKRLKIKRKRRHKGKTKSLSNALLVCSAWLPLGQPQRVPAPGFSGATQQGTGASSPEFQPEEWSSAPHSIALSSFLHSRFTLNFWQVSFHGIRVTSAPLPYSTWPQLQPPTQGQSSSLSALLVQQPFTPQQVS